MPTTQVQVLRRPPTSAGPRALAVHVTYLEVEIPRGAEEHGDVMRQTAKEAVAKFAAIRPAQVSISHRENGGYLAYIPQLQEKTS